MGQWPLSSNFNERPDGRVPHNNCLIKPVLTILIVHLTIESCLCADFPDSDASEGAYNKVDSQIQCYTFSLIKKYTHLLTHFICIILA